VVQVIDAFSLHLLSYTLEEKQAARDNLNRRVSTL
jgi:hypothetical protein